MTIPLRLEQDCDWLQTSSRLLDIATVGKELGISLVDIDNIIADSDVTLFDDSGWRYKRLGIYFEELCFELLKHNRHITLHAANIQLRSSQKTIGEFDVITRNLATDEYTHVEMAVKFYLQRGPGNDMADWIGPGLKDRLDLKYHRIITHQLQLSNKVEEEHLRELDFLPLNRIGLLTRGRLYYRYEDYLRQTFNYPSTISPCHSKGFWMSEKEFVDVSSTQTDIQWYDLIKPYWLAPVTHANLPYLKPFERHSLVGAKQVVAIRDGIELMRGFIVTEEWQAEAVLSFRN